MHFAINSAIAKEAKVANGTATDLGVAKASLKDAVMFNWGFQGRTQRWLNSDRSWISDINAGHDSRPMATRQAETGITETNSQTPFFQQVRAGVQAVSNIFIMSA